MASGKLLIIGFGNRLRGDDAAGYLAAERLRQFVSSPRVEVLAVHQLTPELAEPISQVDRVLFIDAAASGTPGEILERSVLPLPSGRPYTHHATPEGLLASAATLYGRAPEATLYSIAAQSFDLAESLTPPVRRALDLLVERLAPSQP